MFQLNNYFKSGNKKDLSFIFKKRVARDDSEIGIKNSIETQLLE